MTSLMPPNMLTTAKPMNTLWQAVMDEPRRIPAAYCADMAPEVQNLFNALSLLHDASDPAAFDEAMAAFLGRHYGAMAVSMRILDNYRERAEDFRDKWLKARKHAKELEAKYEPPTSEAEPAQRKALRIEHQANKQTPRYAPRTSNKTWIR